MVLHRCIPTALPLSALVLACVVLLAPFGAAAQQAQRVFRIGILDTNRSSLAIPPLLQRLGELGYKEGVNVSFEFTDKGSFDQQAAELAQKQVDLMFVVSDQVIRAAQRATKTIPLVMVGCDALAAGLIASLSHPGGNLTGVSCNTSELAAKRLQMLREVAPRLSRVGLLFNREAPGTQVALKLTSEAAEKFGVAVGQYGVAASADIEPTFSVMQRDAVGGVIVIADRLIYVVRQAIGDEAARYKLPSACSFGFNVEAGCLFSYGPSLPAMYRLAGDYVDKVLKGAKPADLPVQEPTIYEMILNLKTAKALGVTIPQSIRLRLDEVIE
jgi:putative tryptophan/tyrosine transport system substrate-binding protein